MNEQDVAIIGGSAAGLSAALVLARAGRKVTVIDSRSPRNAPATHMHGFLSRDGMDPAELLSVGRTEVEGYGGVITFAEVTELLPNDHHGFRALLATGQCIPARTVLAATGLRDELPDVPGLADRWARDVLHCPYCHGHEVRGRRLGVVGGTPSAVIYAQIVRQWTHDLVYFTPPDALTTAERSGLAARAIDVVEGPIEQVVIDDDQLVGVQMTDGCVVPREALFVPPRFRPNNHLLIGLGCAVDNDGWVTTDSTGRTSVPGVWAAGNVVDPRAQVITAAGAGSAAAIAINAALVDDDIRNAVHVFDLSRGGTLPQHMHDRTDQGVTMTTDPDAAGNKKIVKAGPPTKHQLAVMIWAAVFPTLTVLNLILGDWLSLLIPVVRTFVLATIAVPIVIYGLMPHLHKIRVRILTHAPSN